jgi:hypothetical protein
LTGRETPRVGIFQLAKAHVRKVTGQKRKRSGLRDPASQSPIRPAETRVFERIGHPQILPTRHIFFGDTGCTDPARDGAAPTLDTADGKFAPLGTDEASGQPSVIDLRLGIRRYLVVYQGSGSPRIRFSSFPTGQCPD